MAKLYVFLRGVSKKERAKIVLYLKYRELMKATLTEVNTKFFNGVGCYEEYPDNRASLLTFQTSNSTYQIRIRVSGKFYKMNVGLAIELLKKVDECHYTLIGRERWPAHLGQLNQRYLVTGVEKVLKEIRDEMMTM